MTSLSVIIVSYNTQEFLRDCLRSLEEHAPPDTEIIVVDNGSQDGSICLLQEQFPNVHLIETGKNLGFGRANNRGIEASGGEYVLLLNSDTVVKADALQVMCCFLETHPATGAVGCRLENPDGSLQPSCYKFPSPARALAENLLLTAAFPNHPLIGDYRAWPHDQVRDVDFVIGAALMVRRRVINQIGLLDDRFFLYSEETDWCRRMSQQGWRVTFIPQATIIHYGGQSSLAMKDRQFCESNRSALRYIDKYHGPLGVITYRSTMVMGAMVRLTLWGLAALLPRKRVAVRPTLILWRRILRWHLGFGPHAGVRELALPQTPSTHASVSQPPSC